MARAGNGGLLDSGRRRGLTRQVTGPLGDVARQLREPEQAGGWPRESSAKRRRRPRGRRGSAGCCRARREGEAALRERLEVALELAGGDELRARDVDERPAVARTRPSSVIRSGEARAGDRRRRAGRGKVLGRRARAAAGQRGGAPRGPRAPPRRAGAASRRHRDAAAPRIAGARAARPVAGSRSTACTPPKKRLRARKPTTSRPAARSASRAVARLGVDEPVLEVHARRERPPRAASPWSTRRR